MSQARFSSPIQPLSFIIEIIERPAVSDSRQYLEFLGARLVPDSTFLLGEWLSVLAVPLHRLKRFHRPCLASNDNFASTKLNRLS
jgi:hypothetical protein